MFYKLKVPPGQEAFKIGYLQFYYKHALLSALHSGRMDPITHADVLSWSNFHLQVVPHSILSIRSQYTGSPGVGFSFTQTHTDYKNIVGWQAASAGSVGKRVLVLDTGLDPSNSCTVVDQKNFVDDSNVGDTNDDHGHGTAVTCVINDLCPTAEFVIYKVADANGRASEWDVLAALAARNDADMVNISLAFGLPDRVCAVCGRESHSSRSAVFENLVKRLDQASDGPLIVAAAGNDAVSELAFPARFDNVIAVESVNLAKELSHFTNRATVNQEGNGHKNVFVMPGGDKDPQQADPSEYVGTSSAGAKYYGTSFATAYASGILAALWSQPSHSSKDRAQLLDHLRNNADSGIPGYIQSTHGNGLMQFR